MTVLRSLLLTTSCLVLPTTNAFVVPKLASPVASSTLFMQPDGAEEWMLRDPQEYNSRPNPPVRRREAILQRYHPGQGQQGQGPPPMDPRQPSKDRLPGHLRRKSKPGEEFADSGNDPELYRPANRFDQNDPFVNTPYGQANDIKRPSQQQRGVSYTRANVNEWKAEQDQQDAFINGAYGSGGPNRHGLDIGQQQQQQPRRRQRYRGDPRDQQQQDFINGPYGSRGAPNGYETPSGRTTERVAPGRYPNADPQAEFVNSPYGNRQGPDGYNNNNYGETTGAQPPQERAVPRRTRRRRRTPNDPQEEFANSPYGNRNGPVGYGGQPQKQYERYRKEGRMPPTPEEQFRTHDYAGSNRMEYQGGPQPPVDRYERYMPGDGGDPRNMRDRDQMPPPPGVGPYQPQTRLERYDPRFDAKRQYSDPNDIIERSPGKHLTEEFDPRRYESRPIRSREQRQYELGVRERRQWERRQQEQSAAEEFRDNPNGSSYRASQYGHGNDGW